MQPFEKELIQGRKLQFNALGDLETLL